MATFSQKGNYPVSITRLTNLQYVYIFNRQEKQNHQSSTEAMFLKPASIYIRSKTVSLFYSNPAVEHELFIPYPPVTKELLCVMWT